MDPKVKKLIDQLGEERIIKIFGPRKIFVFGSNLKGIHGAGAAKEALEKYGAVYGQGAGFQGNSFAIPTKETPWKSLPLGTVQVFVDQFLESARKWDWFTFWVTRIGCGRAGFKDEEISPLFKDAPDNCLFDESWKPWLPNHKFWGTYGKTY